MIGDAAKLKPYRSLLFVPGHKGGWVQKGVESGADALILDLEDSVPDENKEQARLTTRESILRLRDSKVRRGVFVRPNAWSTGLAGDDLEAVVVPGLSGLVLPKVESPLDVIRFDTMLDYFEHRAGIPAGAIELLVVFETALSVQLCFEIAKSSSRIASLIGATARNADIARSIGYEWTPTGSETLYLRSRILLASRAANVQLPITGIWQDVHDLEGLAAFSVEGRRLGYRGQLVIHPSHCQVVNQVYTPSPEQIAYFRGLVQAFEASERAGSGALTYDGEHIDYAHVKTARQWLELMRQLDDVTR